MRVLALSGRPVNAEVQVGNPSPDGRDLREHETEMPVEIVSWLCAADERLSRCCLRALGQRSLAIRGSTAEPAIRGRQTYDLSVPRTRASVSAERFEEARRVGVLLTRARVSARRTQEDVAAELGIPQSRIAKLESGQRQLRFVEGLRLAAAYGIEATALDPAAFEQSSGPGANT
jgi:ribosome-binding protein aMBF1 (putative translation factor)